MHKPLAALTALSLLAILAPARAHAAACRADFAPHGYIGAKWQDFHGPDSSLGCPLNAEHDYSPGLAATGLDKARGRQQDFQHGTIVWFPSLGEKMLLSVWWNRPSRIHVEFTGIALPRPHYRVGLSDGIGMKTVDFDGGAGHNSDLDVPYKNGVIVKLLPCEGSAAAYSCAPHIKPGSNPAIELANDGAIVPIISLQPHEAAGSYADNSSHLPPPPPPRPLPGNASLKPAQMRTFWKLAQDGGFQFNPQQLVDPTAIVNEKGSVTTHDLGPMWAMMGTLYTRSSGDGTSKNYAAGFVYDTHKGVRDGHIDFTTRTAFRFDLSALAGRQVISAKLTLHGTRAYVNFGESGELCGTQLGMETEDWWKNQVPLDAADFNGARNAGSQGSTVELDVTSTVAGWLANPLSNQGFVLRNPDENLGAFTEKTCLTQYAEPALAVEFGNGAPAPAPAALKPIPKGFKDAAGAQP